MKKIAFYCYAHGIGDILSATPALKKVIKAYPDGTKFNIFTYHSYIFKHHPILNSFSCEEYSENGYDEVFKLFSRVEGMLPENPNSHIKHNQFDIRQVTAAEFGFTLLPEEMTCEYFPGKFDKTKFELPEKYIVMHCAQTWPSRTWPTDRWQKLISRIEGEKNIPIVLVGKKIETDRTTDPTKIPFDLDLNLGVDLISKTTFDETWHIINNSMAVITNDSGILHIAGTTDVEIFYIGGSINPKLRMPYRKGVQEYKTNLIGGECDIFCASDPKYSILEHGHFHSVPPVMKCLKSYEKHGNKDPKVFECHPSAEKVFDVVKNFIPDEPLLEKRNDNIVVVSVHFDYTNDKRLFIQTWMTVECIENLNNLGFEVIVSSHSQIPKEVSDICKSTVVDLYNPVLKISQESDGSQQWWCDTYLFKVQHRSWNIGKNWSYGCYMNYYNGAEEAKRMGYEKCLFTNYDIRIDDKFVEDLIKFSYGYDGVVYNFGEVLDRDNTETHIYCSLVYFDLEYYFKKFPKLYHHDDWYDNFGEGYSDLESVLDTQIGMDLFDKVNFIKDSDRYRYENGFGYKEYCMPNTVKFLPVKNRDNYSLLYWSTNFQRWERDTSYDINVKLFNNENNELLVNWNIQPKLDFTNWFIYDVNLDESVNEVRVECDVTYKEKLWYVFNDVYKLEELDKNIDVDFLEYKSDDEKLNISYDSLGKDSFEIQSNEVDEYFRYFDVNEGDTVVDLGASLGLVTLKMLERNPDKVYCVEASDLVFKDLCENVKSYDNVIPCKLLIGEEKNIRGIFSDTDEKVDILSFWEFVKENKIDKIDFLKMDIEGAEYEIFNDVDSSNWIKDNVKNMVGEIHIRNDQNERRAEFFDLVNNIKNMGFDLIINSLDGVDITDTLIDNHFLSNQNKNAIDYYREVNFYAINDKFKNFNFDTFILPFKESIENIPEPKPNWAQNPFREFTSRIDFLNYTLNKLYSYKREIHIVETGTTRAYDLCDGQMTLIFAKFIKEYTGGLITTIDISQENINICKDVTKDYEDVINYVCSDSVEYLQSMKDDEVNKIDLFYFDSYDLDIKDPIPSQTHHLNELKSVYDRINKRVIIGVDDNFFPLKDKGLTRWIVPEGTDDKINITKPIGKGVYIDVFLTYKGWKQRMDTDDYTKTQLLYEYDDIKINFSSDALGDTIAWIPYVEEYRIKNNVGVSVKCNWSNLFKKSYPEINFIDDMDNHDIDMGWSWAGNNPDSRHPNDYRLQPMQKTATDLLGLEYQEIKSKIDIPDLKRNIDGKYVCIAIHSTSQAKYWNNPTGWQEVVDFLKDEGYKIVCIDKYHTFGHEKYGDNIIPTGVIDRTGDIAIDDRIRDIKYADFFIGVGSGLSWLSWAIGTHVVMISGFSKPFCEFQSGITRIHNNDICNGCFNSEKYTFDRGNWTWCPEHENTDRMFECSKTITSDIVIREINKILVDFTDGLDGLTR